MSYENLQAEIFDLLAGDTALSAQISGVFDVVPENTAFPYLVFAENDEQQVASINSDNKKIQLIINIFSSNAGRKEVLDINNRIYYLLQRSNLSLSGGGKASLQIDHSSVTLLNDGVTWRGEIIISGIIWL